MQRHIQGSLLLGTVLLAGTLAHAQGAAPGMPAAAPLGAPSSTSTTTSTTNTDVTTAPPAGDVTAGTESGGLGNTGGEPILMALGGTLMAGSALLLRRKLA